MSETGLDELIDDLENMLDKARDLDGEHDVIFAGRDEVIEFNHKAMSKDIFAVGAVKAAKFLAGQKAGFYTMKDVMD